MAALVDKTMGALNEARRPMYPLFEKPQSMFAPTFSIPFLVLKGVFADDLRIAPTSEEQCFLRDNHS